MFDNITNNNSTNHPYDNHRQQWLTI
jgi:hypothetical protein